MENIKWELDDNGVLHMYTEVAQLHKDKYDYWILNSRNLGLDNCEIEFEEVYNEEQAKAYVEGYWNSDEWEGDF